MCPTTASQKVLVLLDRTALASTLVDIGRDMADLLGLELELFHVQEPGSATTEPFGPDKNHWGVPLTVAGGQPAAQILLAIEQPDVALAVMGSRNHPADDRAMGDVTSQVVRAATVPVLVTSPNATWGRDPGMAPTALVPLDGEMRTTTGVEGTMATLRRAGIAVHAVHVLDENAVPLFWDQPGHAAHNFAAVFADRFLPADGTNLEIRTGNPSALLLEAAAQSGCDLIVLCWSPDDDIDRARVVRHTLRHAGVPILLVSTPRSATDRDDGPFKSG